MATKIEGKSKKTAVILQLFDERWDSQTGTLSRPMVTLQDVKTAIEAVEAIPDGKSLSSSNPANFFKDFIRKASAANKNWPRKLTESRWTAEQRTGENNCFEFVPFSEAQTEPFEDPFLPTEATPKHRMQSITIPKVSRDLGRKDEQWMLQVAVQQCLVPTHLALHSSHQIEEIVHLQSSLKLRKTEIDALFLAHLTAGGSRKSALITCEAKHGESILPDQIVNQANAAAKSKKADLVIPMAIKVVVQPGQKAGKTGNLVYVCEFEAFFSDCLLERSSLRVVSDCLYEFQPPIPGI